MQNENDVTILNKDESVTCGQWRVFCSQLESGEPSHYGILWYVHARLPEELDSRLIKFLRNLFLCEANKAGVEACEILTNNS